MYRIHFVIGLLLLTAVKALSQSDTTTERERYCENPRDVKAVTAYADALRACDSLQRAEAVVREYMSRCPVVQLEDRDTYLLINRYVFDDPYSNVFDYGVYLIGRMKWDRDDLTPEQRRERMVRKLSDMRYGVSSGDEIDKRYEVLSLLSRKLSREVDNLCDPRWDEKEGCYVLPGYDPTKCAHITRLLDKGDLIGEDGMRTKLKVAQAYSSVDYDKAMSLLCTAAELNLSGIRGSYLVGMMNTLTAKPVSDSIRSEAIALLSELVREGEAKGSSYNYYNSLANLYSQCGDNENTDKYRAKSQELEEEKQRLYQQMMNR